MPGKILTNKGEIFTALYISDIHYLVDKKVKETNFRDLFRVLKMMKKNETRFHEIFLVGDIIENWYFNASKEIKKKEKGVNKLFDCLESLLIPFGKKIFIIGNHDTHTFRRTSLPANITYFLKDRGWQIQEVFESSQVIVAHGHQGQYNAFYWAFIILILRSLYTLARFIPNTWKKIDRVYSQYLDFKKNYSKKRMLNFYSKLSKRLNQKERVLIVGHTHRAIYLPEMKIINTGDWVESKTFLIQSGNLFKLFSFHTGKKKALKLEFKMTA